MHTFHVVEQVVRSGESIIRAGSVTIFELAEEWLVSVSVESMGLTFVTEKTSGGGKAVVVAVLMLAAEWLDV
jgi:hypothetical protein